MALGIAQITPERSCFAGTFSSVKASWRRFSGALATVLLLAAALLVGFGSAPAAAHAVLEKTTPADGSALQTAPASVSLTFDEAPQAKFSAIHVTGPDGQRKDSGPVTLAGGVVSEQLAGSRPAGRYVVDWRVVSDDGHPVSGQFSFTARAAAPDVVAENGGASHVNASGPGSSNTAGIIIAVVAGVIVVGGLLALLVRRRRRPALPEE